MSLWKSLDGLHTATGIPYGGPMEPLSRVRYVLECEECGNHAIGSARGWRAAIVMDDETVDPVDVAIYCPECWEDEFG
jgi:hypothetical protein